MWKGLLSLCLILVFAGACKKEEKPLRSTTPSSNEATVKDSSKKDPKSSNKPTKQPDKLKKWETPCIPDVSEKKSEKVSPEQTLPAPQKSAPQKTVRRVVEDKLISPTVPESQAVVDPKAPQKKKPLKKTPPLSPAPSSKSSSSALILNPKVAAETYFNEIQFFRFSSRKYDETSGVVEIESPRFRALGSNLSVGFEVGRDMSGNLFSEDSDGPRIQLKSICQNFGFDQLEAFRSDDALQGEPIALFDRAKFVGVRPMNESIRVVESISCSKANEKAKKFLSDYSDDGLSSRSEQILTSEGNAVDLFSSEGRDALENSLALVFRAKEAILNDNRTITIRQPKGKLVSQETVDSEIEETWQPYIYFSDENGNPPLSIWSNVLCRTLGLGNVFFEFAPVLSSDDLVEIVTCEWPAPAPASEAITNPIP